MKQDAFDRTLMDEMSQLPPSPDALQDYTPWQNAMVKLLVGMALVTFQLSFFYLDYILPLLGTSLIYLGCRSLRRSSGWFKLCWLMSGLRLAFHIIWDVLAATPVAGLILADPLWKWGVTWVVQGVNLLMLFALWRGTRAAFFAAPGGQSPARDWLGRGLICYLLTMALALWSDLVPYTEPSLFGAAIMDQYQWIYYGRIVAAIALMVYFLICLARQGETLDGRGYDIVPAPVRVPGGRLILAVFVLVLAAIPPALWLGSHIPTGPGTPPAALTAEQEVVRARLAALGLPEDIAAALDGEELERCAGAEQVEAGRTYDADHTDDEVPVTDGPAVLHQLGWGEAELSSWLVFLPDGQVRQIHWFRYREMPDLHLQEQFSVANSGNFPIDDFSARLLLEQDGQTLAIQPKVHLSGGESADEVEENLNYYMFPESTKMELERLGHLRYYPWIKFSIPKGTHGLRGYLAYTVSDRDQFPEPADIHTDDPENWSYGDFWYVFLRHQERWLHYPFVSISDLGGSRSAGTYGPLQSIYSPFDYYPPAQ